MLEQGLGMFRSVQVRAARQEMFSDQGLADNIRARENFGGRGWRKRVLVLDIVVGGPLQQILRREFVRRW